MKLGPFPTNAEWGSGEIQSWMERLRKQTTQAYPVDSLFISFSSTNPNDQLGYGTWTSVGAGRVLVGLDSGDTDFDTVGETGGSKTVTSTGTLSNESAHTHSVTSNVTVANHGAGTGLAAGADITPAHVVTNNAVTSGAGSSHTHTYTGNATSVVQPYLVVYMWKRTA